MNEKVLLPRSLVNQLLHHAQNSPEFEVCGLIGAKQGIPTTSYPVNNIAANQAQRFLMDPQEQIDAMREIRDKHEEFFAIYHSHPKSAALPSITDLKLAEYPNTLQIIISLNTKGVLEMRGFRFSGNTQAQEVIMGLNPK